ncbi:hypothetical protein ACFC1B_07300 [Streptomyces xiamenensis]|uniref:hypothetical protein n=1 Tax=Streptomyces xiamenensis TaxID=408015 RepID=UPI0035DA2461
MTADDRELLARYGELTTRAHADPLMPDNIRDLVLALGWSALRGSRLDNPWSSVSDLLNISATEIAQLVAADAPRYELDWTTVPSSCQAPAAPPGKPCGTNTVHVFIERDQLTGRAELRGYCNRPGCLDQAVPHPPEDAIQLVPNRGGILPTYFAWNWEAQYGHATAHAGNPGWRPPVHGLSAAEWPETPGHTRPKPFRKLPLAPAGVLLPTVSETT